MIIRISLEEDLMGKVTGLDHYGASAPAAVLMHEYGFTVETVYRRALSILGKRSA